LSYDRQFCAIPPGPRWANDGFFLPADFGLSALLELRRDAMAELLKGLPQTEPASGEMLAPLDAWHEVWAAGVTYLRSRDSQLVRYLTQELDFPKGVLLMTGTGIVPPEDFSLQPGDGVQIRVGSALIENRVQENQS
jgi:fumarylacetoacetate (FAA) hydrolase family protein